MKLRKKDPQIAKLIDLETERQKTSLEMIPSENHSSPAVREALGSLLTDKYAEGSLTSNHGKETHYHTNRGGNRQGGRCAYRKA